MSAASRISILLVPALLCGGASAAKKKAKGKKAKPPTVRIVRSANPKSRIEGLTLQSKKPKVVTKKERKGEPSSLHVTLDFSFASRGRSLLKDDAPVFSATDENAKEDSKVSFEVELTGKATAIQLLALKPSGEMEQEKVIVIASQWKDRDILLEPGAGKDATEKAPADAQAYKVRATGSRNTLFVRHGAEKWVKGDNVCVMFPDGHEECGEIVTVREQGAVVKLSGKPTLSAGQTVYLTSKKAAPREPASEPPAALAEKPKRPEGNLGLEVLILPRFTVFTRTEKDNASGGKADFTSSANFGTELNLRGDWLDRFVPMGYMGVTQDSINPAFAGQFQNPSVAVFSLGAGLGYYPMPSRKLLGFLLFGYHERFVTRSVTRTTLLLDKVGLLRLAIGATYELFSNPEYKLLFDARGHVYASGSTDNYSVRGGAGLASSLTLIREIKHFQLYGALLFELDKLGTSILDYNQKEFGAEIGVGWRF